MKYLLVLAVVAIAIYIWRNNRRESMRDAREEAARRAGSAKGKLPQPEAMARCAHCGMHLPASEAVPGRLGHYCSAAHRQLDEG